jgi:TRAP-type C4-dicarboxylate transport system permease small subunit
MMQRFKTLRFTAFIIALGVPIFLAHPAFAASGSVTQVQSFIKSVIELIAGLAGLVATVFFVIGGYQYITSSGNPDHLDKAKRTLFHSALGLSIVIAAFVIANIVTTLATNAFGS